MIINTNIEALKTTNILNESHSLLARSLARLSSGAKIVNPKDDAAGLAVSSRMKGQISRVDSALSNVSSGMSWTQTQDGFMKTLEGAFRRMGELAMLSLDGTKSDADRELYQAEFSQLQSFITATASKEFNGVSLFNTTSLAVTIDSDGNTFDAVPIDISGNASYAIAISSVSTGIGSTASASVALDTVKNAISRVAIDRASLGAVQARLNFSREQLTVTKENLSSAVSRITDIDVAEEATQYAKYQILVQSGTSMLAQANALPQAALQLLQ
ncbi:MAG TPA: flagellin [Verrucomicrobiales bacterium]|nr:flagellin [Verrucomicrobiales bacterium]